MSLLWHQKHNFSTFYLQAHGIMSIDNYNYKENLNWTSNDTQVSPQELFESATFSFKEIVRSLSIRTISEDTDGTFYQTADPIEFASSIIEQRHRKFGRCYTFYPKMSQQKLGIYYVKVELYV